jgi:two-component system nitrate/nitrite response regulator NarL
MKAKVLLVDDQALFRQGVRSAISREADIEVVGEARDGVEALGKAQDLEPDIVLMDIHLGAVSGLETITEIKRELPDVKVVILTVHDQDENLFEAIKRGAEGFLSKEVRAEDLIESLRCVIKGEVAISRLMTSKLVREFARLAQIESGGTWGRLTTREKEVLGKLRDGLSNQEIATELCISENTVKAHVTNILHKLHLQSRAQAAFYARQWGI